MDLIKKGQRLTLFFQKDSNMVEMSCTVEEVYEDRLVLNLPQYFMRYIEFMQTGKKLTAKVFSKLGTIDFNALVITSPLEEIFSIEMDQNAMKLTPGKNIPVIQAIESIDIIKETGVIKLKTFEISTDHLKFYSDEPFTKDETFDCNLILPDDYGIIKFKAAVSEIDPVFDNEYTIRYLNMTEDDRQTLLYYMYMYGSTTD